LFFRQQWCITCFVTYRNKVRNNSNFRMVAFIACAYMILLIFIVIVINRCSTTNVLVVWFVLYGWSLQKLLHIDFHYQLISQHLLFDLWLQQYIPHFYSFFMLLFFLLSDIHCIINHVYEMFHFCFVRPLISVFEQTSINFLWWTAYIEFYFLFWYILYCQICVVQKFYVVDSS